MKEFRQQTSPCRQSTNHEAQAFFCDVPKPTDDILRAVWQNGIFWEVAGWEYDPSERPEAGIVAIKHYLYQKLSGEIQCCSEKLFKSFENQHNHYSSIQLADCNLKAILIYSEYSYPACYIMNRLPSLENKERFNCRGKTDNVKYQCKHGRAMFLTLPNLRISTHCFTIFSNATLGNTIGLTSSLIEIKEKEMWTP